MAAGVVGASSVVGRLARSARQDDYLESTPTLGRERAYIRRSELVRRIADLAFRYPVAQADALLRLASWLDGLPANMPSPFLAVGDDGSVSAEWDVSGSSLHVTFYSDFDEAYFVDSRGDEWESSTESVDKMLSAVRSIATQAQG